MKRAQTAPAPRSKPESHEQSDKGGQLPGLIVRTRWPGSMGGRDASGRVRRKPTVHRSQSAPIGRIAVAKLLRPMFC